MQDRQLSYLSEFLDPHQEDRYRCDSVEHARRVNYILAIPILLGCVAFAAADLISADVAWPMVVPRLLAALVILGLCWQNHIGRRWQTLYLVSYITALTPMVAVLRVDLLRPVNYLTHIGVDVIIIMAVYVALPTIRAQCMVSVPFTVSLLVIHFLHKQPDFPVAEVVVPLSLLLANYIGLALSIQYNRGRRQLFARVETEKAMHDELLQARSEAHQLARLIPMCANCKKIRNDDGYWEQVETYMQATSGTMVSHGICPECVSELYDDVDGLPTDE